MATCVLSVCSCGERYGVYVPKATMGKWMGQSVEDLRELRAMDGEEEASGEIDFLPSLAKHIGATIVDLRKTAIVICSCGEMLDFEEMLAKDLAPADG